MKRAAVFVHGFMGNRTLFSFLLDAAREEGYEPLLCVLPGHEADLAAFARHKKRDWQQGLDAFLAQTRRAYDEVFLITHSMGGLLAIHAAIQNPEKIKGIAALALPLFLHTTPEGTKEKLLSILPEKATEPERVRAAREMCGVSGITPFNAVRLLPNTLLLPGMARAARRELKGLGAPLVCIYSGRDEVVSPRSLAYLKRARKEARVLELETSGHFWFSREEQAQIVRCVREALRAAAR